MEAAILLNGCTLITCGLLASIITHHHLSMKWLIGTIMSSLIGCLSFFNYSELMMVLWFGFISYHYLFNQFHFLWCWFGMYFMCLLTYLKFLVGSIHNFMYFPQINVSYAIALLLLIGIMIGLYLNKDKLRLSEHMRMVYIANQWVLGYLDSGNVATYLNKNLIFVSPRIYSCIDSEEISCEVSTIQGSQIMLAKLGFIEVNAIKQEVLVVKSASEFVGGCEVLLNERGR